MKLYVGGVYQGQSELAQQENPKAELFFDFHETIRKAVLQEGQEPRAFARQFCEEYPTAVVIAPKMRYIIISRYFVNSFFSIMLLGF